MFKKVLVVVMALAAIIGFSTCASTYTLSMSPRIVNEIGTENVNKFYYYLSKDVFLEYDNTYKDGVRFDNGVALPVIKHVKDIIKIDIKTPGSAIALKDMESGFIPYKLAGVSFEEGDDRIIPFGAVMNNPDGRFELLFDDEDKKAVIYGGKLYRVTYSGDEKPYLMVKVGKNDIKEGAYRKAGGRTSAN